MFKINLTSLILLVAFVGLLVFTVRQCDEKKAYEAAYEGQIKRVGDWGLKVSTKYKEEKKVLQDSVMFFKEQSDGHLAKAKALRKEIKRLEDGLSDVKAEMEEIPYHSSYGFLTALYPPFSAKEFPFSGDQVRQLHTNYLQGKKCREIKENLELENKYLNLSLRTSSDMNLKMKGEAELCDQAVLALQEELTVKHEDNLVLKRKVWRIRVIAGASTALFVLVLI